MTTLGLIPARGGSKGVPRKNLRELGGRPLVAWTIEAAAACPAVERIVVSTDDPEIAALCRTLGAEAPFLRPAELAADETPDRPVCEHALDWLATNDGYRPDAVAWLRPTAPLREPEDIAGAIDVLAGSDCDSVRSVCPVEKHPYWMGTIEDGRLRPLIADADAERFERRQLLPPVYRLNGAVDVVRPQSVGRSRALFGGDVRAYVMPPERSVDLDTELDFAWAELLLARRRTG